MSSETSPLLSGAERDGPSPARSKPASFTTIIDHVKRFRTFYLLIVFTFVIDFAEFARMAVGLRMLENRICRNYYSQLNPSLIGPGGDVREEYCKIPAVQSKLAKVQGLIGTFGILPGLIVAVPYGILADHWGRRLVCILGLVGIVLAESWFYITMTLYTVFPLWSMYMSSLFLLIGGSGFVLAATILAIVADIVPAELRTQSFFVFGVVILISELFAPATGSALMDKWGANTTYLIGIASYPLALIILLCIPETAKRKDVSEPTVDDPAPNGSSAAPEERSKFRQRLEALLEHVRTDLMPLLSRGTIVLGLLAFLINSLARPVFAILIQYMSVRFGWKLGQSAYLLSYQAVVNLFMLCFTLPLFSAYLTRRFKDTDRSNLVLSKISIVFLVLGPLGIGLSPNAAGILISVAISAFGSGFTAGLRSFLTSLVPPNEIALLYTLLAIFSSIGSLIGVPLLALTFSKGIEMGGFARGFPFFFTAVVYVLSGISIWNIRSPQKGEEESRDEDAA